MNLCYNQSTVADVGSRQWHS